MREVKFRGYSIDDKCWITGYGVEKITEDGFFIPTGCANDTYEVFKESIGEYTGEKDINGIEIYEGDIVETTRELNHIVGVVTMIKGCWYIQDGKNSYYRLIPRFGTAENKVIGNAYENKSLLEED